MPTCPACQASLSEGAKFCTSCGAKAPRGPTSTEDPLIGRIFASNFRIEKLLGVGGMGKVYKGVQISLDKPVVLKVLHPHYADDETIVHRFHREARAASRLNHPNSINIIDFGQDEDGTLFMAMEFISGRDLFTMMYSEPQLPEQRIADILIQVCSALADAHEQGVIHRDLKPENIMVERRRDQQDFVKVLDFGIAKLQNPEGHETRALTAAGMVCGTPEYMAPEQARGEELDARTDVYALGVLLYQMATNELPFQADNAIGIVTKHIVEQPVPPREKAPDKNISPALEEIILRCMAKKPEERFATVLDLQRALKALAGPGASGGAGALARGAPAAEVGGGALSSTSATVADITEAKTQLQGQTAAPVAGRSILPLVVGGTAVVCVIAVIVVWFMRQGGGGVVATDKVDAGIKVDVAVALTAGKDAAVIAVAQPGVDAGAEHASDPLPAKVDAGSPAVKQADAAAAGTAKPAEDLEPKNVVPEVDRRRVEALLDKGDKRYQAGDGEAALEYYKKAREIAPGYATVHMKMGMAYLALQKTDQMCASLRKFLKLQAKHPQARHYRSLIKEYCSAPK